MKLFTKVPAPTEKTYSISIESRVESEIYKNKNFLTNRVLSDEQFSEKAKQHLYLLGMNITESDMKSSDLWKKYINTLDELFQWEYQPNETVLNISVVERHEHTKTPYQLNESDEVKQQILEQLN